MPSLLEANVTLLLSGVHMAWVLLPVCVSWRKSNAPVRL